MAFAGPIAAFSATQNNPNRFATIFRFGITPLFLFSGTFFPITSLPAALQALAWLTPLYHGVALTRGLSLGTIGDDPLATVVHLVYPRDAGRRGRLSLHADDRAPVDPRMTALRVARRLQHRQPSLDATDRAEPVRLPARLDGPPVGLLRAALLPARDRLRARGADRDDPGTGRRSRSPTSCSWRRRSSPARR